MGILTRAEQAMGKAGENLLVERLHQILDDRGSTALMLLTERLLPLLQALIIVLPGSLSQGASPALLVAARTLGTALHEQGISYSDLIENGTIIHDRLMQAIMRDLRTSDRALITAILHISRSLMEVEGAILRAYQEESTAALTQAPFEDPRTGLATWSYFVHKLADELQVLQRRERSLALIIVEAGTAATQSTEQIAERVAWLLQREIRRMDLAARRDDGLFVVLLPETDRESADTFLKRLKGVAATIDPALYLDCATVIAPEDGLTGEELMLKAEQMLAGSHAR